MTEYKFSICLEYFNEVKMWCQRNLGKRSYRWDHNMPPLSWPNKTVTFYLIRDEDAMAFKLRWT